MSVECETRLPVTTVQRIHRAVGGDPVVEEMILRFIANHYSAKNLFYLSHLVATAILKRPSDFIRAAKRFCEPELPF
jgi:hypothetical protein